MTKISDLLAIPAQIINIYEHDCHYLLKCVEYCRNVYVVVYTYLIMKMQ